MHYLLLLLFSIAFVESFIYLKILADTQLVLNLSKEAVTVMGSKEMSDREKESFMKKNSLLLMATTFKFILKFALIVALLYGLFYATKFISNNITELLLEYLASPLAMIILTGVTLFYVWIRNVVSKKL